MPRDLPKLSHLNDLHVGALRSGGTTPERALALRSFLLSETEKLLMRVDTDLLVNGDLFDTFNIPLTDLLEAYLIFTKWLDSNDHKLYLSQGNHDCHSNSSLTSSFLFFSKLLSEQYPSRVVVITEPYQINEHWYVIPHMVNQDRFDAALTQVPECDVLFLHANYDNHFAVQSDHSLNVSEAQARESKATKLVFAHEHHDRIGCGGKVIVCGNQIPSSVSDCLAGQAKQFLQFTGGTPTSVVLGRASYKELDWRNLEDTDAQFVRIAGQANTEEAAMVVAAISRYRSSSSAFVVSNAVRIDSGDEEHVFAAALDEATSFDVLAALKELVTPEEWAVIERAYAGQPATN